MDFNISPEAPLPQPERSSFRQYFIDLYSFFRFTVQFFKEILFPPYEFKEILRQCYYIGFKSFTLISITAFITGIVFTKQSRPSLTDFGATAWLPNLVGIAFIRALAPLVTALIAAGKIGSGIGAEIGSMKVTEQIDAMEVAATNPFKFLVCSRIVATTLMTPVLVMYTGLIGMLGAYLNVHVNEMTSMQTFFEGAFSSLSFLDLYTIVFKSVVYGFTIGLVGCYKGYTATQGTLGVGKAANSAVVTTMFLIFIEEMLIVQIVNAVRDLL